MLSCCSLDDLDPASDRRNADVGKGEDHVVAARCERLRGHRANDGSCGALDIDSAPLDCQLDVARVHVGVVGHGARGHQDYLARSDELRQ